MTRRIPQTLMPTLALAFALALTGAGVASADTTLGTTTQPAGSSGNSCFPQVLWGQTSSGTGTPYALASAGIIKQWSTRVTGETPGNDVELVVLRPTGGTLTVVGVDRESVPSPLPASGVATFSIASPILAQAGDFLALYSASSSGVNCYWSGGAEPSGAEVSEIANPGPAPLTAPPSPGQTVQVVPTPPMNGEVDVSAQVAPAVSDAAVSAGFAPAKPTLGNLAVLQANVVNHGPAPATLTFSDTVPAGLTVEAATAGNGTCSVAGQLVTCTIPNVASGGASTVNVIVSPASKGTYTNSVSVSLPAGYTDPNPANNSSTTTVTVGNAGPSSCVVPKLKGTPAGVAKRALKLLGCKVKVKHAKGHGVPKGTVLKTKPHAGTYALGKKITLIVRK